MANGRQVVFPSGSGGGGGGAPTTATYILETANGSLPNAFALGSLATGILKVTTTTGVPSIATGSDLNTTFGSQTQNQVYASPNGSAGPPSFRALVAGDIPNLDASKITAGQLALARGGTNADLSATGAANSFLKQSSSGAAVTVGTIASADINTALTTPGPIGSSTANTGAFTTATITTTDSATATILDLLTIAHDSSGAAAANTFGEAVKFNGQSSTTADRDMGRIEAVWQTATDATRKSQININVYDTSTKRSVLQVQTTNILLSGTDSATASVTNVFTATHASTGTPAANFGTGAMLFINSNTGTIREGSRWRTYWQTATDASRKANAVLSAWDTAERDVIGIAANGSVGQLGFFSISTAPVIQQATTGTATGFTAGSGTAVQDVSTFTGGTGATAYRISDIVLALKNYGLLAA